MEVILIISTILGGLAAVDYLVGRFGKGNYRSIWSRPKSLTEQSAATLSRLSNRYTSDQIAEINWEWKWGKSGVEKLTPLCPRCSYEPDLRPEPTGYNPLVRLRENPPPKPRYTEMICDNCGFTKRWDKPPEQFLKHVRREIDRRKRIGERKEARKPRM